MVLSLGDWLRTVDWPSWAGAGGTLALAVATFFQMRKTRRDQREKLHRELADRIYGPVRREVLGWADPVRALSGVMHATVALGERRIAASWPALDLEFPYLTRHVPHDVRVRLDEAHAELRGLRHDWTTLRELLPKEAERIGGVLRGEPNRRDRVYISASNGGGQGLEVDLSAVWATGMTVQDWVTWRTGEHRMVGPWKLQLFIENKVMGDEGDVERLQREVFAALEQDDAARRAREGYQRLLRMRAVLLEDMDRLLGTGHRRDPAKNGPSA